MKKEDVLLFSFLYLPALRLFEAVSENSSSMTLCTLPAAFGLMFTASILPSIFPVMIPYDKKRPAVCLDEANRQLIEETRAPPVWARCLV
jgi:hypothetical protein